MKYSELLRIIKKNGWKFDRHGTRHDLYINDDIPNVQIPIARHIAKEVPTGTLNEIYKAAGLK